MKVKFILPALTEAKSPFWRPIKYSLFPPLGLATLAAFLAPDDEAELVDDHVEALSTDDAPDLVVIQVYITNAYRAYAIADHYRARGCFVALGGLHVTALPDEAALHADSIFLGPGEQIFPDFLADLRAGAPKPLYASTAGRTLEALPPIRRDLIRRELYLVPNSIVVTRGCPQHCDFCYKDAFFAGGRSFYAQRVDAALAEIERLPGRHLYFLDDHLLGDRRFAAGLFEGMRGMGRLFQGAATVDSVLRGDLVERAAEAGLRSLFVGFETFDPANLLASNKKQNLARDYAAVCRRLSDLGIMINGSFVFGMDEDGPDVFDRTVQWAVANGVTTATFHIQTPYPGTRLHSSLDKAGRITSRDWDLYDTRHIVYRPARLTPEALEAGYQRAYRDFYGWGNIARGAWSHGGVKHRAKHFFYAAGWKKFEPLWNLVIKARRLALMTPLLEGVLSKVSGGEAAAGGDPPGPPTAKSCLAPIFPNAAKPAETTCIGPMVTSHYRLEGKSRPRRTRVERRNGMRVAALLERASAEDRRRFMRHPVSFGAGLASESGRPGSPVTVVDLSTHGCGIEVSGHCEPGSRVWLKLPGLESWPSRIVWAQGDRAGLSFDRPLHEAVVARYA